MKKGKKTIRLTESEMVSMIERIVNEVKREKRNQISESRRKPISLNESRGPKKIIGTSPRRRRR